MNNSEKKKARSHWSNAATFFSNSNAEDFFINSSIQEQSSIFKIRTTRFKNKLKGSWIQVQVDIMFIKLTNQDSVYQDSRSRSQDSRRISKGLEFKYKSISDPSNPQIKFKFKIKLEAFEFIFAKANQRIHRDCKIHKLKSIKWLLLYFSCPNCYFLDYNVIV